MSEVREQTTIASSGEWERHPAFSLWPQEALHELNVKSVQVECADGATLYSAGQPSAGIYLVRSGRVELLLPATRGKFVVSHVVEAGGTIGLGPVVSGKPYEFTARIIGPAVLCFVPREEFMTVLSRYPQATISVSETLSREVELAYRRLVALRA
jgi:CRP-like cAMP-binding protein